MCHIAGTLVLGAKQCAQLCGVQAAFYSHHSACSCSHPARPFVLAEWVCHAVRGSLLSSTRRAFTCLLQRVGAFQRRCARMWAQNKLDSPIFLAGHSLQSRTMSFTLGNISERNCRYQSNPKIFRHFKRSLSQVKSSHKLVLTSCRDATFAANLIYSKRYRMHRHQLLRRRRKLAVSTAAAEPRLGRLRLAYLC